MLVLEEIRFHTVLMNDTWTLLSVTVAAVNRFQAKVESMRCASATLECSSITNLCLKSPWCRCQWVTHMTRMCPIACHSTTSGSSVSGGMMYKSSDINTSRGNPHRVRYELRAEKDIRVDIVQECP